MKQLPWGLIMIVILSSILAGACIIYIGKFTPLLAAAGGIIVAFCLVSLAILIINKL